MAAVETTRARLSRRALITFTVTTLASAALLVVLFLRLLGASQAVVSGGGASPVVGRPAPNFTIPLYTGAPGKSLSLSDLKGKAVVLNFWASWCDACKEEAPVLEGGSQRYAAQGVVFIGIAYEDLEPDSRRFIQQYQVTYPNGPDKTGKIAISYGVLGVPETYFISRDGIVKEKFSGALSPRLLDERVAKIV